MKRLFSLLLACALCSVLLSGCASTSSTPKESGTTTETAEPTSGTDWPTRPITIIVPYGAGGDTDFNARAYLEGLREELGTSLVVSNVTGSGGSIASRQVKDSKPDGYTALFFHTAMNVNEAIGTADFGLDDFKLACVVGKGPGEIIVARKDAPYTNLSELKAYTQEHPGEVKMGIETGTMVHINGKQMQDAGIDVSFVDAGGASDRVAALAGGHIDIIINAYGTVKDYLETGEFVALGQVNSERSDGFPDIPTAVEQGVDVHLEKYYFFAFPKDTPDEIVQKFADACKVVSEDATYAESIMGSYRQTPFYTDAEEGRALLNSTKEIINKYAAELLA